MRADIRKNVGRAAFARLTAGAGGQDYVGRRGILPTCCPLEFGLSVPPGPTGGIAGVNTVRAVAEGLLLGARQNQ